MNFRSFGLVIFLIGLAVAVGAAINWKRLEDVQIEVAYDAAMAYTGFANSEFSRLSEKGTGLRKEQKQMIPWIIGGSILGLVGLGMILSSKGQPASRRCPHCAESVLVEAVICKHCHRELPAVASVSPNSYRALRDAAEAAEAQGNKPRG